MICEICRRAGKGEPLKHIRIVRVTSEEMLRQVTEFIDSLPHTDQQQEAAFHVRALAPSVVSTLEPTADTKESQ